MLRLARYLKHYKKEVILGPFFKLLEAIFELIVPLVMASIIDTGIRGGDRVYVLQRGGILLLLGTSGLIFALICQYSASKASQGFGTMVRNDLFSHINSLSHGELDGFGTNFLITVITNDVNQMQLAVAMLIRLVVRAPFLVVGAIIMAMLLDLKLSIVFLVVAPLVSFILYWVMKKSVPFYKVRQKVLDRISMITRENLTGARVIRAFSTQDKEEKRFEDTNEEAAQIAIRVGKLSAILNPATFTIMNMAIIAIIWFGGIQVDTGHLTQGEVIAFVNYMTQISLALVVVANLVVIFTKAGASATRINQVFDTKPHMQEGKVTIEVLEQEKGDGISQKPIISLREVFFAYPDSEEYALENITFDVMPGETIGIIGGTGSGKSTLINLLPRLNDATKGELLINGLDIKEYSYDALRRQFGIAPQKTVLFSGSIRDNLRMAKEDATDEEIRRAIRISQSEEFVETLSKGYDSEISQGGKNLSGGQRQRLTIARALIRNPKILILDDSASALDYSTEAKLRKALYTECGGMTIIMVSQRAGSIRHADKIIVMDDGKIAGIGTHNQLIKSCEVYREICHSQPGMEEVTEA
jgi:ATP-binding cassette subfamily B protein